MTDSLSGPRSSLDLRQPRIMGVLNVTPDSFSDGGHHNSLERALAHAHRMAENGADIIDIGGESTRPGADPVSTGQEMERVMPVLRELRRRYDLWISVDTSSPEVMTAAAEAGADMLNDVRALNRPGAAEAAAATGLPVCLMHMQGQPGTMQLDPDYQDVVGEVRQYLTARAEAAGVAGIPAEKIVLDPGFGFGKTLTHNLHLLAALPELCRLGYPVLAGMSRKRMIGELTGRDDPLDRVPGSVAAALLAVDAGARIVRVHDVAETRDALSVWQGLQDAERERRQSS